MRNLAPAIYRKRLLAEGFFDINVNGETLKDFFSYITGKLELKTYGEAIVHFTSGVGADVNQGYDAFVPLIDSGIYVAIWSNQRFFSMVMYTCKDFDENIAVKITKNFFKIDDLEWALF